MSKNFANIVEEIKRLSNKDKQELKFLLEKYIIEEEREKIYRNYKQSSKEVRDNQIEFSNDLDKLKGTLDG
jgi:hypothetical protein